VGKSQEKVGKTPFFECHPFCRGDTFLTKSPKKVGRKFFRPCASSKNRHRAQKKWAKPIFHFRKSGQKIAKNRPRNLPRIDKNKSASKTSALTNQPNFSSYVRNILRISAIGFRKELITSFGSTTGSTRCL
jgi:hypothetical protein